MRPALACFLFGSVPLSAFAATVTVIDSHTSAFTKVRRDDAAPATTTQIYLEAAQNEFEGFQIVVTGPASNLGIRASPLIGPGGVSISAASCDASGHGTAGNIRIYQEDFIQIGTGFGGSPSTIAPRSDQNGVGGWVPDALIPQVDEYFNECRWPPGGFTVAPGQNAVFWVDILVPQQAAAGHYTGKVVLTWTSTNPCDTSATISVDLKVWDFPLPSSSSLRSYFGSTTYAGLSDQHGVSGTALTNLLIEYAAMGLDHRISMTNYDDGNTGNLSQYDANFGPLNLGRSTVTRLPNAATTRVAFIGDKDSTSSYDTWNTSFGQHSWWGKVFSYTVDEPCTPQETYCFKDQLGFRYSDIHSRGTTAHHDTLSYVIPTLVTKDIGSLRTNATAYAYTVDPVGSVDTADVNISSPVIDALEHTLPTVGNARDTYDSFLSDLSGPNHSLAINDVWTYESCDTHGCASYANPPTISGINTTTANIPDPLWPSISAIDHTLVRARAMPWIAFKDDVRGILYYDTLLAFVKSFVDHQGAKGGDPWHSQYLSGGNGDGTLFYPGHPCTSCDPYFGGTTDIPVASLRLKMIREGMEDYEYMNQLKQFSAEEDSWAVSQVANVFPNAWTTDQTNIATALWTARHDMACRYLQDIGRPDAECAGGGGGGICSPPKTQCSDGQCVDFSNTQDHCGNCTNSCYSWQICSGGTCVCKNAPQDCLPNEYWDDITCRCST